MATLKLNFARTELKVDRSSRGLYCEERLWAHCTAPEHGLNVGKYLFRAHSPQIAGPC